MKTSRGELKAIVKECLLEILNEGLGGTQSTQRMSRTQSVSQPVFSESSRRTSAHDQVRRPTSQLRDAIRFEAGGNKVMESILADTAASTLPKMIQSEGRTAPVAGGLAEQVVSTADPEELFGEEAASKWASLAFMEGNTKK